MTNLLTADEASNVLRCETTDALMLNLLPAIDSFIRAATGHDWTADSAINEAAKSAARMLLVMWHENPAMQGNVNELSYGLSAALTQLEAVALRYKNFAGLNGAGSISVPGAKVGATVSTLTGLIGVSGDRRADFESVITIADEIQQVSSSDLSANYYRAYLLTVGEL